jgi:ParB-like chromosome segregation protein Spo0J
VSDAAVSKTSRRVGPGVLSFPRRATVPVDSLLPADSPRSRGEDDEHIKRLAESGAKLPPILVHDGTMRVIDGMHRLRAAMLNGCHSIEVEFFSGDDEETFIRAVERNVAHGLPLTLADRKRAAARILRSRPALADRAVASMTGLSPKTVGAVRASPSEEIPRLDARQGRDGRQRPLDRGEGRLRAAEVIRSNPSASLREISASAGISPETARSVKTQLAAGIDPARNRGRRSGRTVEQPAEGVVSRTEAGADAGVPGPQNRQSADESSTILQKLSRDPALRHSETGRRLLQIIRAKAVDDAVRAMLMQEIPPHSRRMLIQIARYNAKIWKEIENELRAP